MDLKTDDAIPAATENNFIKKPPWKEQNYLPARFIVIGMAFLGMIFNYMLRINMNITIVVMVKFTAVNDNNTLDPCNFGFDNEKGGYNGNLPWSALSQSLIVGSFFWGYFWTQIPGGRLADLIGAKRVFGLAILSSALLSLFVPVASLGGAEAVICVRFLMGLAQGPTYPSTASLLARWSPPMERSFMSSLIYSGPLAGAIITFPLSAAIIASLGWEAVFYIQAAVAIVWTGLWFIIVTDHPEDFWCISDAEKNYINESLGTSTTRQAQPIPFKAIFKSLPFWAILVVGFSGNWGFYTVITDLPLYFRNVLHKDIRSNALLSGLPFLGMMIFSLLISACSDKLQRKGILSTIVLRRTATAIGQMGPAVCLFSMSLIRCNQIGAIGLLFTAVILQGAIHSGALVNHLDIAPNFAGTLCGIANAVASTAAWIAPMIAGLLTNHDHTFQQWEIVFYIVGAMFIAGSLFYLIFSSADIQYWNDSSAGNGTVGLEETTFGMGEDGIVNSWGTI